MARRKNYRYILKIQPPEIYRVKRDEDITLDLLNKLIADHANQIRLRDNILKDAYETKYDILDISKY